MVDGDFSKFLMLLTHCLMLLTYLTSKSQPTLLEGSLSSSARLYVTVAASEMEDF